MRRAAIPGGWRRTAAHSLWWVGGRPVFLVRGPSVERDCCVSSRTLRLARGAVQKPRLPCMASGMKDTSKQPIGLCCLFWAVQSSRALNCTRGSFVTRPAVPEKSWAVGEQVPVAVAARLRVSSGAQTDITAPSALKSGGEIAALSPHRADVAAMAWWSTRGRGGAERHARPG